MTWNAMDPAEVCDVLEFWKSATWPLSKADAQQLAVEQLGWTTVEGRKGKRYLQNPGSGLNLSGVTLATGIRNVMSVGWRVTDGIPEVTDESLEFLGDRFTLLVREGESRWGAARIVRKGKRQNASWDTSGGGRFWFSASDVGVMAEYRTPQGTALEKRRARRGGGDT